jgi:hypothetical protein
VKAIYGTKQAALVWYQEIDGTLNHLGFQRLGADPCIYLRRKGDKMIILALYVDDIFGTGNDPEGVEWLKDQLRLKYEITDLGEIYQCLGMVVTRDPSDGSLLLNSPTYIENMVSKFNMQDSNTLDLPGEQNYYLNHQMCYPNLDGENPIASLFCSLVGSLMFAAINWRPEISMRVGHMARFMQNPGEPHLKAAKRVLRYLKGTPNHGLKYVRIPGVSFSQAFPILVACSDSNHAADADRVSISGYILQLVDKSSIGNLPPMFNVISYRSKRQTGKTIEGKTLGEIALSSTEAEYYAATMCAREIMHKRNLLMETGYPQENATIMYIDNQSIEPIASQWKVGDRTKHIDIEHHYIRLRTIAKDIIMVHVSSEENTADMMTKPQGGAAFRFCRSKIMADASGSR